LNEFTKNLNQKYKSGNKKFRNQNVCFLLRDVDARRPPPLSIFFVFSTAVFYLKIYSLLHFRCACTYGITCCACIKKLNKWQCAGFPLWFIILNLNCGFVAEQRTRKPAKEKLYTFKDDISKRWFEKCRRLFSEIILPTKLWFKKHTYCSSLKIALNLSFHNEI